MGGWMDTSTSPSSIGGRAAAQGRWLQLVIGVICMAMIANLQYGWTFFVGPLSDKYHWTKSAIQVAFSVFVFLETWLVPVEGYLVDRFGPSLVTVGGGILVAIAWSMDAVASSLPVLYLAAGIGGVGAGAVYGTCVGNALKWFPDRRGLAAGLTAMGFGAGSALTVIPIQSMIKSVGYEQTFLYFGIGQGVVVFVLGWLLKAPGADVLAALPKPKRVPVARADYTPVQMAKTPVFWVMYLMFVLMATGGLMATAQLAPIAKDFKVSDVPVATVMGWTLTAVTFAALFDRILNGVARPFFGWVSDWFGRENTMFVAFLAEAAGILALSQYGRNPAAFVLLSGLVFFAWGEIYSLFPSTCGDTYGSRFAAANAGLLYTAKGTASLLVPLSSVLAESGGWHTVFYAAAAMNVLAAVLALVALKPLRRRLNERVPLGVGASAAT
ncbi:MAG TPA: oxalate/formate MFS antiporter [Haliangiales bacterium]|nr:oxalate/formate MFS antiporter [Haliangiales bacterium]